MRKYILSILCILFCCVVLCSCLSKEADISKNPNNSSEVMIDNTELIELERFGTTENQAIFFSQVKDNWIDAEYLSEQCEFTTKHMVELELKYAKIWMQELDYSLGTLSSILNEEKKSILESSQNNWKNYVENKFEFEDDIFIGEDYQMGTLFKVECASEYRKEIRKRALYVKYIQFCMENKDIVWTKNNTGDGSVS